MTDGLAEEQSRNSGQSDESEAARKEREKKEEEDPRLSLVGVVQQPWAPDVEPNNVSNVFYQELLRILGVGPSLDGIPRRSRQLQDSFVWQAASG